MTIEKIISAAAEQLVVEECSRVAGWTPDHDPFNRFDATFVRKAVIAAVEKAVAQELEKQLPALEQTVRDDVQRLLSTHSIKLVWEKAVQKQMERP